MRQGVLPAKVWHQGEQSVPHFSAESSAAIHHRHEVLAIPDWQSAYEPIPRRLLGIA
jgi:hypothetical protein